MAVPAATHPTPDAAAVVPWRSRIAWPSLIETAVTLAAIAALLPGFARLAVDDGRDARFADTALPVRVLPPPIVGTLCMSHATLAEPLVRGRLCSRVSATSRAGDVPVATLLAAQWRNVARAFDEPAEVRPLACAFEHVTAALRSPTRPGDERAATAAANATLLLAAALDGHAATGNVAASARLPPPGWHAACAALPLPDALDQGAALIAGARAATWTRAKNQAMRSLLVTAGWQWAAWMLAGLVLVKLARSRLSAPVGLAVVFATWACAAWAGRVPWPLAQDRSLELGRNDARWDAMPAGFVIALVAIAAVVLALAPWLRRSFAPVRQTLASRAGYAGFVVASGVGWLLLLDLSANGPPGNRYLALYHHGHLWLAMLVLTACAFVRPALAYALATLLSVVNELAGRIGRMLGGALASVTVVLLIVVIVAATGAMLAGVRQFTSELGRVWLIVGVAWFFFLRGAPVTERLVRSGSLAVSLVRYVWPLAFVALVLLGAMHVTRDMGPLLIASYAAGAFLAASIAISWHLHSGAVRMPALVAIVAFAAWIVAVTLAVFEFGTVDEVTAARLENLAAPLASVNDQLALVTWFRQAAPADGFGLGNVPWCGFARAAACAGVPAQIQSDYTFTALVGAFGWSAAWAITLGCAVWLHRVIRYHGRVTRGEPRFVRREGRIVADNQAFLSWIGLTWVVLTLCQLAVTVAGNLSVLPLTGVTFPFVSFGMTSLVVNSAFLALCINVNLPETRDA